LYNKDKTRIRTRTVLF